MDSLWNNSYQMLDGKIMDEEAAKKMKELINEVLDERRKSNMTNLEHELHHEWVKNQIKKNRRVSEVARDALIKWGVPAGIAAFLYGLADVLKAKLGLG